MGKLNLRLFWVSFYVILWLTFSRNVSLTVLFIHTVVMPFIFIFSKKFRGYCIYVPFATPLLRHDDPKKFGLDIARNFNIKFESNYDNCTINLGVWHALPKSLVKKHRFQLNSGSKDKIDELFIDELKNSEYPIFLYFHGILGTRASAYRVDMYNLVQDLDAHVVTFDYRGFGDSTNVVPRKIGVVEDGLMVYSWIRSVVGNDRTVFIWGHSMGAAISQRAFSKLKPYSHSLLNLKVALPPPQGFILEAGCNSIIDLSTEYTPAKFITWLPHFEKLLLRTLKNSENRLIPENYAESLRQYPVLILHSRDDGVITYHFGETLYKKHKSVRKEGDRDSPVIFKTFENDGHMGICKNPATPGFIKDFIVKHKRVTQ